MSRVTSTLPALAASPRPRASSGARCGAAITGAGSRPGLRTARSCSTRCSPTRRPTTACARNELARRTQTSTTRPATSRSRRLVAAVRGRYELRGAGTAQGRILGIRALRRPKTVWPPLSGDESTSLAAGGVELVLRLLTTPSPRPSSTWRSASSTSAGSTRRPGRGKHAGVCAYTVPSVHPTSAQLRRAPARRAGAGAELATASRGARGHARGSFTRARR